MQRANLNSSVFHAIVEAGFREVSVAVDLFRRCDERRRFGSEKRDERLGASI
jgi:hypothetical protein